MINNIYKEVEDHVTKMFEANTKAKLIFHALDHTRKIVKRTEEIAAPGEDNSAPAPTCELAPGTFSLRQRFTNRKASS